MNLPSHIDWPLLIHSVAQHQALRGKNAYICHSFCRFTQFKLNIIPGQSETVLQGISQQNPQLHSGYNDHSNHNYPTPPRKRTPQHPYDRVQPPSILIIYFVI
jgi:hypothetical protein